MLSLARTGDPSGIRRLASSELSRHMPGVVAVHVAMLSAKAHMYTGDVASAENAVVEALRLPLPVLGCSREAELLGIHAWSGAVERARAAWAPIADTVTRGRPDDDGRLGVYGLVPAAMALALIGDNAACAELYPGLEALIAAGHVFTLHDVGPTSPQLAAAVSAAAAGFTDRARGHFEEALRLAHELPDRALQPTVRTFYGRFLASPGADTHGRGVAMLREAVADFDTLGMPLHRDSAAAWLEAAATEYTS
jgi:hypothetical protein